jgi:hypothetical protein
VLPLDSPVVASGEQPDTARRSRPIAMQDGVRTRSVRE